MSVTMAVDDGDVLTCPVAFRQRDRFDPVRGTVRAWLHGIATNLIREHRRAEERGVGSRPHRVRKRLRAALNDDLMEG